MTNRYLVRVELVDLAPGLDSWETYEAVHETMEKAGFLKTWKGLNGDMLLPDATYLGNSVEMDALEVAKALSARIKALSLKCRVLVCNAPMGGIAATGLEAA